MTWTIGLGVPHERKGEHGRRRGDGRKINDNDHGTFQAENTVRDGTIGR